MRLLALEVENARTGRGAGTGWEGVEKLAGWHVTRNSCDLTPTLEYIAKAQVSYILMLLRGILSLAEPRSCY
jgi:hypothetical protein